MPFDTAQTPRMSQPLSGGFRNGLFVVILLVIGFCSQVFVGVRTLDTQVERWSYLEELDDARERLVQEVRRHLNSDDVPHARAVLDVFNSMSDRVEDLQRIAPQDPFALEAEALLARARRLFIQTNHQRAKATTRAARMSDQLARLKEEVRIWTVALEAKRISLGQRSVKSAEAQRISAAKERTLTTAMLHVQTVQRKLDAVHRNEGTTASKLRAAALDTFDAATLPTPCSAEDRAADLRLCAPSLDRVFRAISSLDTADDADVERGVFALNIALDAYVQAGEAEYARLIRKRSGIIEEAQQHRIELAKIGRLEHIAGRTGRVLEGVETLLDSAYRGSGSLARIDLQMPLQHAQLKARMLAFVRLDDNGLDESEIMKVAKSVHLGWEGMMNELHMRDRIYSEFRREMASLATEISGTVNSVRKSTGLWVNIFAGVSLAASILLAGTFLTALWFARSFILVPMSRVTSVIHRLADGKLGGQIDLTRTTLGYSKLRDALQRLSAAMQERIALAERNAQQKSIIEHNMREMEKTHEEIQWLAMHDPLTQLPNRRHADEDLADLTLRAKSNRQNFCLIQIDVDRFKEVNDTLGHEAGDFVLRHVAQVISSRATDQIRCYRIGGDEFLMACTGDVEKEKIAAFADAVVQEMALPIEYAGHTCRIGGSLGIAFGKDAHFDAAATLVNADLALYETKRGGRNGHRFYAYELQEISRKRKTMGDRVLEAIEAEEFIPFYQPQFYANGLQLRGVETLCRWHVADLGWVPPSEFLGIAEDRKIVGKIDQILLKKASQDILRLRKKGLSIPKISFNITADRLTKNDLADDLLSACGPDVKVALELLESMSLDTLSDSVRWSIDMLKERGVSIEIDDFGSCRASVAGLIAVGPDAMKIDGSLIMPMAESEQHLNLVRAIIEIGRALDIEVVGEGVETQIHVDMLRDLGCDVLQGFRIGTPYADFKTDRKFKHLERWRAQSESRFHRVTQRPSGAVHLEKTAHYQESINVEP